MNFSAVYRLFRFPKNSIIPIQYAIQTKDYAKPVIQSGMKKTKKITIARKKILPVETDVNRLLTYVCGTNLYKEGGEDVKIKPDSEYPDWLWTLRTGPPPTLEELDPNTKQYWRKLRLLGLRRNNKRQATKKF
ncbi:LOW QUALITY PROTEIN: 39S ribosomal protein L54, mitochondrial [Nylanderia fulva]|uniref:LOW QUALITY PROTEIN: 39S ribosomal protein L54, mitochondrial n=1 Tax=Nylanderia fulva TaxID=613905 RepID=UPI0010FB6125|nr:LOW QUALITY PROTEIN: 39S ribosomal protein L54, mitochondrial [Nylanderia fulva]